MLPSKFFVSLHSLFDKLNLIKLQKNSIRQLRSRSSRETTCPKTAEPTNPFAKSRLGNYKEALQKCPGSQSSQVCKTDTLRTKCPDAPANAGDAYAHAFAETRRKALDLQIFTGNATKDLTTSLATENSKRFAEEKNRVAGRLREIEAKVDRIVDMSIACGAEKRHESYAIAEKINANLQTWQCENKSGELRVKSRLEALECKVKERTDTAVEIVRTCRGCVSPWTLLMCVEMTAKDASNIIKTTEEYVRSELASVKKIKEQVLRENEDIVARMMKDFEAEAMSFMKRLDSCAAELKKINKKC